MSRLEWSITVARRSTYYMTHIFATVFLLDVILWGLFVIDPAALNDRVQVAMAYYLAMVAFQFVVAETLPKINHSTPISNYFSVHYVIIMLASIESVAVYLLDKNDGPAGTVDWVALGVVAFAHLLIFSFYALKAFRARK